MRLALPSVKVGAVISDDQANVPHAHPEYGVWPFLRNPSAEGRRRMCLDAGPDLPALPCFSGHINANGACVLQEKHLLSTISKTLHYLLDSYYIMDY